MMMIDARKPQAGFSLLEVLVSIAVVGVLVPSLLTAMGVSAITLQASEEKGMWAAAVQSQVEELVGLGYSNISADSATVDGYPMSWSVQGTDPKIVTIAVAKGQLAAGSAADTLLLIFPATDSLAGS